MRSTNPVGKWVFDGLDNGLVKFGFLTFHFDAALLFTHGRQVANQPWKLGPDISDRLHACLHDTFLQFGSDQVQTLHSVCKRSAGA